MSANSFSVLLRSLLNAMYLGGSLSTETGQTSPGSLPAVPTPIATIHPLFCSIFQILADLHGIAKSKKLSVSKEMSKMICKCLRFRGLFSQSSSNFHKFSMLPNFIAKEAVACLITGLSRAIRGYKEHQKMHGARYVSG